MMRKLQTEAPWFENTDSLIAAINANGEARSRGDASEADADPGHACRNSASR
jgi:hypothetical protein